MTNTINETLADVAERRASLRRRACVIKEESNRLIERLHAR
jgi:hypothetical protein